MSEQNTSFSPNREPKPTYTFLFRGVSTQEDRARMGAWWTTNPYYALAFANGSTGSMFVAKVDTASLSDIAQNISQDEDYENYGFVDNDPVDARPVTSEEVEALMAVSQAESIGGLSSDLPGGPLMKTPSNPVEIGKKVFGSNF